MANIRAGWSPAARGGQITVTSARIARQRPRSSDPFSPPVALYGEVQVPSGSSAEIPVDSISNTSGQPIEVREIRFIVAINQPTNNYLDPASVINATISVNDKPLMATPTPIWAIARLDRATNQRTYDTIAPPRPSVTYVLRLSRPLRLPANAQVKCRLDHTGLINAAVDVGVCLAGKHATGPAGALALPYVLFWASAFRAKDETASESAPERVLKNTLGRALRVTRLICRHITLFSDNSLGAAGELALTDGREGFAPGAGLPDFGQLAPITSATAMKLITSRNQKIIPDPTPIWDVFPTSGALEVPHVLPANDFYRLTLATIPINAEAVAALAAVTTFRHQIHFSAVGWREEVL